MNRPASPNNSPSRSGAVARGWRIAWTVVSAAVVESLVLGFSVAPAALVWETLAHWSAPPAWLRMPWLAVSFGAAYVLFALCLMVVSALGVRVVGWRTPAHAELVIADLEWPLLGWARYLMSAHVVRLLAGPVFRATPVWTFYHRLNGARLGRRVYINSMTVMDDNLLEFGEGTVIGDGVHLSGHTVEAGIVKTAPVRLGAHVTIGVESVIGIGVEIGAGTQVGALSLVPKHRRLEGEAIYGGIPVERLDQRGGV